MTTRGELVAGGPVDEDAHVLTGLGRHVSPDAVTMPRTVRELVAFGERVAAGSEDPS